MRIEADQTDAHRRKETEQLRASLALLVAAFVGVATGASIAPLRGEREQGFWEGCGATGEQRSPLQGFLPPLQGEAGVGMGFFPTRIPAWGRLRKRKTKHAKLEPPKISP
jgi:hypothetical protein